MISERSGSKAGSVGGRFSRKRRSPWLRKKFLVLSLAGATLLGGGALVAPQLQDRASAASGDRHFIQITTKGAPLWYADAELYAGDGSRVYKWKQAKSGGRVLWEFTDGGDDGWVNVYIGSGAISVESWTELPLDRDHCFQLNPGGQPRYTGDSITGGCTSE